VLIVLKSGNLNLLEPLGHVQACNGIAFSNNKFDGGEEIKPYIECTYLGTKIDQSGENTTQIKQRISQTRKVINALNSIWWHKNTTKTENYILIKL
jgi:hypothetical protein